MKLDPETRRRARELRRNQSPAEEILWRELRGSRFAPFKFRRQHPVGRYFADFYCEMCKLIVELDGETHVGNEENDGRRTKELEALGCRVIRFWNHDVFDDKETVLEAIWAECEGRRP